MSEQWADKPACGGRGQGQPEGCWEAAGRLLAGFLTGERPFRGA